METNEIIDELRERYIKWGSRPDIYLTLDGELLQDLFEFCIGALEVYYAVFKKSDRFEELMREVDR